ncbi:MAG TPA: SLBB domain-containing protein [Pyrinomonadaceae bacterium]|nr:SLBB domain-containing protein [Pyrinomonadaceae bacterium]
MHFGDIVDVDFVGGFEFDWRGGLNASGDLDGLPEADEPIRALCRTEAEIAADVTKAYAKFLKEPKVVVKIVDRSNRALVQLNGAIRTPTRFKVMRPVHLRELLIIAGGLTDDASGEISVFRPRDVGCDAPPTDNSESVSRTLKITVADLLAGKPDADPAVLSGDIISVERASAVYVIGAVNNPRPIYSRAEMTFSRAVATAGGLSKDADGGKAVILRREYGETRSIAIDLDTVKADNSKDAVLKPFDIIDVASRGGGDRKLPPQLELAGQKTNPSAAPLRIVD